MILGGKAHLFGSEGNRHIFHSGQILDLPFHFRRAVGAAEIFQIINRFFQAVIGHGANALRQASSADITVFRVRVAQFTGTIRAVNRFQTMGLFFFIFRIMVVLPITAQFISVLLAGTGLF